MEPPIIPDIPPTALAPMQEITDLPFMRTVARFGAPDYFFTEYFRVHPTSKLEPWILASITEHGTGRPVYAQLLGDDPVAMAAAARELQHYPIAGVDLNMGCPAPKIYRKAAGGGLMRDLAHADRMIGALRDACPGSFSVKMRVGFETPDAFADFLALINKHQVDHLTIHGRTVRQMYRGDVAYDLIKMAVKTVRCPVFANGNITSAVKAQEVAEHTKAYGLMIGRSAIRNPWIFAQARARLARHRISHNDALGANHAVPEYPYPTLADVRHYISLLWEASDEPKLTEQRHVARMKKYLNFIGQAVDSEGRFLYYMRRTVTAAELFAVCDRYLVDNDRAGHAFPEEPYPGLLARPTREGEQHPAPNEEETCAAELG